MGIIGKCKKCGRKGLFFKVNSEGLCSNCVTLTQLEAREYELNQKIAELTPLLEDEQKTYNTIKRQAEFAAIAAVRNQITELEKEQAEKQTAVDELTEKNKKLLSDKDSMEKKYYKAKTLFESYQAACKAYAKSDETTLDESFLNSLEVTVELPLNCMNVKKLRSMYNDNKKLIKDCLKKYEGRYTTKANAAIYKLMTIALEAELQNILYGINYGKLTSAETSVKEMTQKYLAVAIEGNQSIASTVKKFIAEIEVLFIEAVKIEYEYFVQKERIKEEQRAIREQMRQEAEERKRLEAEKKQIEKEENKYKDEMQNVRDQISNTADSAKIAMLQQRLAQLQSQLENVEKKKEDIVTLQNGKAGYVYVISNLGSFGNNVFKVGMTRRSEPMDRVNELGDASVPFPFDVHSFIFSNDAVGLEHALHVELNERRVNKVNLRKEFFRVSLDELENLVYKYQPTAEFNRTMLAEQYNQSISSNFVHHEITEFIDDDE